MQLDEEYICNNINEKNPQLRAGFLKTVVVEGMPYRKNLDL
jgi:hypothetical protein